MSNHDEQRNSYLEQIVEICEPVLTLTPDAVVIYDLHGRTQYVNESFVRTFGWTIEDLAGEEMPYITASEREATMAAVRSVIEEERESSGFTTKGYTKDGHLLDISLSASLLSDRGGNLAGTVVILRDIGESKKAEELLRESEARYRSLFEQISNAVAVYRAENDGEDFTFVDFNGAAEEIDRISREQLIGRSVLEMFPRVKEFGLFGVFQRVWRTGQPERHPVTVHRDERIEGWRDNFVYKLPTGEIVAVYTDETHRKRAEEELGQSEERFRAIFESTTDYVWVKDRSLRYTHANPAMCKLLGLPASQIIGWRADDIFGPESGQRLQVLEARVLSGESLDLERTRNVQGTMLTFHDTLVPLRSQSGEIIGLCCISRNITERKRAARVAPITGRAYSAPAMRAAMEQARLAAASDGIVLLQGESGSGKDFLARWIHDHSKRSGGPYFSINCAAVPGQLAESELFGHERGSFTGAVGTKRGLLELAEGGTILLNEIGELSLSLQAKPLTFLDTRSFMRVGGQRHIQVNARLIAATHRDLRSEATEKRFLEPLFYRINVFPIHVPPLRERSEDLPVLVEEIMSKLAAELQLTVVPIVDPSVISLLRKYQWPGNVRELRNVLERALILWRGGQFTIQMPRVRRPGQEEPLAKSEDKDWSYVVRFRPDKGIEAIVKEVETSVCEYALKISHGNKNMAARLLKISRGALYRHMKKCKGKPNT